MLVFYTYLREVGMLFVHFAVHLMHPNILYQFLNINVPNTKLLDNCKYFVCSLSFTSPCRSCFLKGPECWSHFRDSGLSQCFTTSQPVSVSPITLMCHTLAPIIAIIAFHVCNSEYVENSRNLFYDFCSSAKLSLTSGGQKSAIL